MLILFLFYNDLRQKREGVSSAIWIPFTWLFLAGSRYVSQWLSLSAPTEASADFYLEGSPLDRAVFLALIVLGVFIIVRRKVDWTKLLTKNTWALLFFLFGLISILWSEYPTVSFKRLFKASGNLVMAIVILTEENPLEAIGAIIRRLAFLLLPLSVLFIKYYPDLGRTYHMGMPSYTGVASQKNGLGQICLIVGIYYLWEIFLKNKDRGIPRKRRDPIIYLTILVMLVWLLNKSDSATSIICMVVTLCLLLLSRLPGMAQQPNKLLIIGASVAFVIVLLEITLNLSGVIITSIGRDPSLTTRVPMWNRLLQMQKNPILGFGFESFWLGPRLEVLLQKYGVRQAHNGYLETYLNLGLTGLIILVASLLSGLNKVRKQLSIDYRFAVLKILFIVTIAFYNWTEATFYGVSNLWVLFFLGILEPLNVRLADAHESPGRARLVGIAG